MESEKHQFETGQEKFGTIDVWKSPEGKIIRMSDIEVKDDDKIVIVQRHQKPAPFSKERLLKSPPPDVQELKNLDFTYNPEVTLMGTEEEKRIISLCLKIFGEMDLIATTPMKRGAEHRKILEENFPSATRDDQADLLLDDSGIGLLGESLYGAFSYSPDEARKLFKQTLEHGVHFGKRSDTDKQKPFSYMEAWVKSAYMPENSRWKTESPEDLAEKTQKLLRLISKPKNYFITHEANCVEVI